MTGVGFGSGLPFPSDAKFVGTSLSEPFPSIENENERKNYGANLIKGGLERTVPATSVNTNAGTAITPSPRGDIKPDKYYSVDPIYLKNLDRYKNLGKRLNAMEISQQREFVKRQITADLANSKSWSDVIAKARSYRFSLFKEEARRAAKEHDQKIKNIQMQRALAIHNLKFDVDPPLITSKDIDGIVGGLGRGVASSVSVTDLDKAPLDFGSSSASLDTGYGVSDNQ